MNDPMEKKAVHSWSRLSSAGQSALEEALRVFNPMSKDLTDTETQLVTFLQGLREEGFQATVLSSKDVYGYKSTTANTPPPKTKIPSKPPAVVPSKTQTKNPNGKVSSSTVDLSVKAPKVPSKPPAKKTPNLLLSSFRKTNLKKSKVSGVDFAPGVYPSAYPTMRLSVVLEAIVPASSIEAGLRSRSAVGKTVSKGRSNQSYQCVIRQNSPTDNGRILKENNACNTLGVVNGRILVNSPSSRHNGLTQSKPNTKLQVDVIVREDKRQQVGKDKKRKPPDALQDASPHKKIKIFIPLAKKPTLDKDKYDLLKSKVIKVDRASSDEDVRRKAQQILKVNLSPVLRIQPLLFNLS